MDEQYTLSSVLSDTLGKSTYEMLDSINIAKAEPSLLDAKGCHNINHWLGGSIEQDIMYYAVGSALSNDDTTILDSESTVISDIQDIWYHKDADTIGEQILMDNLSPKFIIKSDICFECAGYEEPCITHKATVYFM